MKKFIFVMFLLFLFVLISSYSYANTMFKDLSNNIFRLHILANSDSQEDQELKLKVRDAVLQYLKPLTYDCKNKNEVILIISNNLVELQKIAIATIKENGYNYNVTLEIGNFNFPTKIYGNISMPAGNYDALRIKIGKANGQNWWCSLYPSLCFCNISNGIIDNIAKNNLQKNLSNEEFEILTQKSPKTQLKFKIIELFN